MVGRNGDELKWLGWANVSNDYPALLVYRHSCAEAIGDNYYSIIHTTYTSQFMNRQKK